MFRSRWRPSRPPGTDAHGDPGPCPDQRRRRCGLPWTILDLLDAHIDHHRTGRIMSRHDGTPAAETTMSACGHRGKVWTFVDTPGSPPQHRDGRPTIRLRRRRPPAALDGHPVDWIMVMTASAVHGRIATAVDDVSMLAGLTPPHPCRGGRGLDHIRIDAVGHGHVNHDRGNPSRR